MKLFDKFWFYWLTLICIWNFGWPNALAHYDVLVAVALSIIIFKIKFKK